MKKIIILLWIYIVIQIATFVWYDVSSRFILEPLSKKMYLKQHGSLESSQCIPLPSELITILLFIFFILPFLIWIILLLIRFKKQIKLGIIDYLQLLILSTYITLLVYFDIDTIKEVFDRITEYNNLK